MTEDICIEWLLEESEVDTSCLPEGSLSQLTPMTLDEEIREILIPLNHPIGATCIQVVGLGTTYECVIHYSQQNKQNFDEASIGHALLGLLAAFTIITFICWKYWLPRHLSWITCSLLAITTWILAEWSLFLD